jgi:hypothetical protein
MRGLRLLRLPILYSDFSILTSLPTSAFYILLSSLA